MMIEIRSLYKEDSLDDLIALSRAFFLEYEAYHEDFFKIDVLRDEHFVSYFTRLRDHENGTVIIALDGTRMIGYISVYVADQAEYWQVKKVGHISGLMVQQEYRGKGIGTKLLQTAQRFFADKGVKYYTVFTAVANQTGLNFYQRNGLSPLHMTLIGEVQPA